MTGPNAIVMQIAAWLQTQAGRSADDDRRLPDLQLDSRRIQAGDVFVAVPGGRDDGRDFLAAAVQRGARAALVEADGWDGRDIGVPVLAVRDLARLLGHLAAYVYGAPSEHLLSIAVTGTNGKTSCSQWIAQALTRHGRRCGVIGTVGSGFPDAPLAESALTTPDAIALQREVRRLLAAGARALVMEVSSIGLAQGRVNGMKFDIALFTNLTRDHLDYHGTMAQYETAKFSLFDGSTLTHAVINLDDAAGQRLLAHLASRSRAGLLLIGYTTADAACPPEVAVRLASRNLRSTADGLAGAIDIEWGEADATAAAHRDRERINFSVPLVGVFNAANLLGVTGVLVASGLNAGDIAAVLPLLLPPPGRMQRIDEAGAPLALVDYAHTPDALVQVLAALRPLAQARAGRLWVVFGAGGDRDPGKRALMGGAAARGADHVVITSDNPRSEDPQVIVAAILQGARAAQTTAVIECCIDRADAIARALAQADAKDVVLIAGKGHEEYQEVRGHKSPFADAEHARAGLRARPNTTAAVAVAPTLVFAPDPQIHWA